VWDLVNSIATTEGIQQRLVLVPGQYRATTAVTGTLHIFNAMTYTVYYSNSLDVLPPDIWRVQDTLIGSSRVVTAEITDHSGLARVVLAYTTDNGVWQVVAMTSIPDTDLFTASLPDAASLIYFVQALDNAANVSVADYKAYYHGPGGGQVDTLPPVTTAHLTPAQPDGANGWYVSSPVMVTLTAVDDISGVAYTSYRLNSGDWLTYTTPLTITAVGTNTLLYRSVDVAGNMEVIQTVMIRIDQVQPESAVTNIPTTVEDGSIPISWTASDIGSGVDVVRLWVQFGQSGPWTMSSLSQSGNSGIFEFSPGQGAGTYCFSTQAVDVAGNTEAAPEGPGEHCVTYLAATNYTIYLPMVVK
jgi:hypothetical protein